MDKSPHDNDTTRQRLLEAAGEVFAEQGFSKATVRDICTRAGANIAAVNYHFGDKEKLYCEVVRYAQGCALEKYPPGLGLPPDAPAADRLRAFVLSFLLRLMDDGRPAWHGKIMSREMAEPTAAMDVIVREHIRPHFGHLFELVRELLGGDPDNETVRLCCQSVIGQCLFYHFGRGVSERLFPQRPYRMQDAERLADHITRFSLAALRDLAKEDGR